VTVTTAKPRALLWPTVMTGLALAILLGLGTWQLERKAWKEGLIQRIADRSRAAPVPVASLLARARSGDDIAYTRASARGHQIGKSLLLFHPKGTQAGYHVYSPYITTDGHVLVVNRGFVPEALSAGIETADLRPDGIVDLVGLVRLPARKGAFDPENDVQRNRWYWRDLAGMLRAVRADAAIAYPFFLDLEAPRTRPTGAPAYPEPGSTIVQLPNRHLEYALTWYGLAVTLIGVYLAFVLPRRTPAP
jgi:surfeit locus 1 family protein